MPRFARPEMLIETDELAARLNEPNLRIVDNDIFPMYQRAHIPGAVGNRGDHYFKGEGDRRFIAPPEEFAAMMEALGIGDDTEVVGGDGAEDGVDGAGRGACHRHFPFVGIAGYATWWQSQYGFGLQTVK